MTTHYEPSTGFFDGTVVTVPDQLIRPAPIHSAPIEFLRTVLVGTRIYQEEYPAGRYLIRTNLLDPISTAVGENLQSISVGGHTFHQNIDCFAIAGAAGEVVRDVVYDHPGGQLPVGFSSSLGNGANPNIAGRTTIAAVEVYDGTGMQLSQPVVDPNPPATTVKSFVEEVEGPGTGNAIVFTVDGSMDFYGKQSDSSKKAVTDSAFRTPLLENLIIGDADALVVWPRGGGAPFTYAFTPAGAIGAGEQTVFPADEFERTSIAPWTANGIGTGHTAAITGSAGAKKLRISTGSAPGVDSLEYVRLDNSGAAWPADGGIEFEFDISTLGVVGPSFWLRDFGDYVSGGHGGLYAGCDVAGNTLSLNTRDGIPTGPQPHGTYANIDSTPFTWAVAHYFCRYEAQGNAIRIYVGLTPYIPGATPWTLTAIDSFNVVPNPGAVSIFAGDHGANLGAYHIDVDKVRVYALGSIPGGGGGGTGEWDVVTSGGVQSNSGPGVDWPTLTGNGNPSPQLYLGYAGCGAEGLGGTDAGGFTAIPTTDHSGSLLLSGIVPTGATVTPSASMVSSNVSSGMGLIVQNSVPGTPSMTPLASAADTALRSLAINPTRVGDLLVVWVQTEAFLSPTVTALTSPAVGGALTLVRGVSAGSNQFYEFRGTIVATGPSTVDSTWSGSLTGPVEMAAVEVTNGAPTGGGGGGSTPGVGAWSAPASGGPHNNGAGTTDAFPALTAGSAGPQLYVGYCATAGLAATGVNAGFTQTVLPATGNAILTGPVAQGATVTPVGGMAGSFASETFGMIVQGPAGTTIVPTTLGANGGNGVSAVSIAPTAIGDAIAVTVLVAANSPTVTGLSGGGVTTWTLVKVSTDGSTYHAYQFLGIVTATGVHALTAAFSGAIGSNFVEIVAIQLHASSGGVTPPTGSFAVVGKKIIGPDGNQLLNWGGVNISAGDHEDWGRNSIGLSGAAKTPWNMKIVRFNWNPYVTPATNDVHALIAEFTSKGIVCLVDLHAYQSGTYLSGGDLASAAAAWATFAARYKDNKYVWIELQNEPGQENGGPASTQWRDSMATMAAAVRGAGFTGIMMMNGCEWGQDNGTYGAGFVPDNKSAIITFGPALLAAYGPNLVFGHHSYDQWTYGDAIMANYIDRIQALGMAMIMSEGGARGWWSDAEPFKIMDAAITACFRVLPSRGVPILLWHGQGNGGGEGFSICAGEGRVAWFDQVNSSNPAVKPTNWAPYPGGSELWDLLHS